MSPIYENLKITGAIILFMVGSLNILMIYYEPEQFWSNDWTAYFNMFVALYNLIQGLGWYKSWRLAALNGR